MAKIIFSGHQKLNGLPNPVGLLILEVNIFQSLANLWKIATMLEIPVDLVGDVPWSHESYVTLNGRASKRFIDPTVDLLTEQRCFKNKKWILPITAYAAIPMATYARYTRSAILDTLNKPFVTVLRAKGLSERKILFRHVIKNSAIPLVTVFLPMFIGTATGSIFVEAMFRVPGLGAYFVSSIENKDYPLEMSLLLMITVMFCFAYFIADLIYALLNPRIRLGDKKKQ